MAIWNEMRHARVQVALEAVLLRVFSKPGQTLERSIIQSKEFRTGVLYPWADFSLKKQIAYTEETIPELANVKVGRGRSILLFYIVGGQKYSNRVPVADRKVTRCTIRRSRA